MALLLQHETAKFMRANLSAFFIVSCLLSLAIQIPTGHMGWSHLLLSLPLLPAAFLGYLVAERYSHLVPPSLVRLASLGLCSGSGLIAVINYWQ